MENMECGITGDFCKIVCKMQVPGKCIRIENMWKYDSSSSVMGYTRNTCFNSIEKYAIYAICIPNACA